jgi:sugar transferase (PEP-CTERM system associated)
MKGPVFRYFALDVLLALAALAVATLVAAGGLEGLHQRWGMPRESVRFLLLAVVPSALLGMVPRSHGTLWSHVRSVLLIALSAGASLFILYLLNSVHPLHPDTMRYLLTALAAFVALKVVLGPGGALRGAVPGLVQRVLIVGDDSLAEEMGDMTERNGGRFQVLGRVDCPRDCTDPTGRAANCSTLLRVAKNFMADKLVVSLGERRGVLPMQEMLACKLGGIDVIDAPSFYEEVNQKLLIENITPSWFIFNPGFRVGAGLRAAKRCTDIVMSVFGLLVSLPLVPFIVLAIKLTSPGPVLFRQERVGAGDQVFTLYKFRTMRQDAEARTGAVWSKANDPRVTPVGRFLRKSRLDEIPQLLNILQGSMSLVGPRPERPEFVDALKEEIPYYSERHTVKPGLTGWAQVCYPYGASVRDALEKLRYDLYYIKHLSLLLDLRIIVRTVGVVLRGKGAR